MVRDEIAGFLLSMNTYNEGARAFWLEAYGGRPYVVDRKKRTGAVLFNYLVVGWYGGIQPDRLAKVMSDVDDGLLARFTWIWPEPVTFGRPKHKPDIDFAITALDRLRELNMALDAEGKRTPVLIPLDDDAVTALVAFAREAQKRQLEASGLLRSAYRKAHGLVPRLSLVLEYLAWCGRDVPRQQPARVSVGSVVRAVKFVTDYALPMADRTYGDTACSPVERNVTTLARRIARECHWTEVHVRHLQREVRPGLTEAQAIHEACAALVGAGWLFDPSPGAFQRKPRSAYPINPRVRELV